MDYDLCDRPLAMKPLISYRYRGRYGWIMIGAMNNDAALSEARRSLGHGEAAIVENLQVWGGEKYVDVVGGDK